MGCQGILLFILSLQFSGHCSGNFIETPSSMTVEFEGGVDQTVVFRCRHERPDAIISWKLNETSSRLYFDVVDAFVFEMGARVDTLTVPVIPVYNNTEVVCSAFVDGTPENSSAATLIITETTSTTSTTTPSQPIDTTSSAPPSIPPTGDFMTFPSSHIAAVEQDRVTYGCEHSTATDIFWSIDTPSGDPITTSITRSHRAEGGMISNLTVETRLEYNKTRVECGVVVDRDTQPQYTPTVKLLIQDTPGNVTNLICERSPSNSTTLVTRWDSVFSLDLNNTDPDIVYSFEVYDITCGHNDLMHHNSSMEVNITNNTIDPWQVYKVAVTPRNNVDNATDGTRTEINETFLMPSGDMLYNLSRTNNISFTDSRPVPLYYTLKLESLDGIEQTVEANITVERERLQSRLEMNLVGEMPRRRLWNASVLAYGCQEHVTYMKLSTHEIQNVSVTSESGDIRVTGDYASGSEATGVLVVIYSFENTSEVHYTASNREDYINISITRLRASSEYGVSTFMLVDGVPFERAVAMPKTLRVSSSTSSGQRSTKSLSSEVDITLSSLRYELQSTSTGVCITCTFLESSTATDCVAVVHQRISQLNSSAGLMNIESSHKFTRSGDTASGCIEGVNLRDRQVGVIGGRIVQPITEIEGTSNSGEVIGGVVLVIATLLGIAVVFLIVFALWSKRRQKERIDHGNYYEPETGLYDIVTDNFSRVPHSVMSGMQGTLADQISANQTPDAMESESLLSPPIPERTEGSNILIEDDAGELLHDGILPRTLADQTLAAGPPPIPERTEESNILIEDDTSSPVPVHLMEMSCLNSVGLATSNRAEESSPDPLYDQPGLSSQSDTISHDPTYDQPGPLSGNNTSRTEESLPDPLYDQPGLPSQNNTIAPGITKQDLSTTQDLSGLPSWNSTSRTEDNSSDPQYDQPGVPSKNNAATPVPTQNLPGLPSKDDTSIVEDISHDPTYDKPGLLNTRSNGKTVQAEDSPNSTLVPDHYTLPDLKANTPSIPPPPATEKVVYDEIDKFQNPQGQHYAMLAELHAQPASLEIPDDLCKTQYSEVGPQVVTQTVASVGTEVEPETTSKKPNSTSGDSVSPPFNLEQLIDHLLPVVSKWQELGVALSLDEDILDEIYTNNDTDEECLRDMLERYMMRSDMKHNWEEVDDALEKVNGSGDVREETGSQPSLALPPGVDNAQKESISVDSSSQVSECTEHDTRDTSICIPTVRLPPTTVGHLDDERTGSRLCEVESHDSMSTATPLSFSCLQDELPQTLLPQSVIRQETQHHEVDYLTELKKSLLGTLSLRTPSIATDSHKDSEESCHPTQNSACLSAQEWTYEHHGQTSPTSSRTVLRSSESVWENQDMSMHASGDEANENRNVALHSLSQSGKSRSQTCCCQKLKHHQALLQRTTWLKQLYSWFEEVVYHPISLLVDRLSYPMLGFLMFALSRLKQVVDGHVHSSIGHSIVHYSTYHHLTMLS